MALEPHALPRICFASKQLYKEAVPIFIQRTRFIFSTQNAQQMLAFDHFVSGFEKGVESIRMLSVYNVKGYGSLRFSRAFYPEALISRCTGLRSLILEASAKPLIHYLPTSENAEISSARLCTKAELQLLWGFTNLLELRNLEYFRLCFVVSLRDLRKLGFLRAELVIENVKAVLEQEFEENGRSTVRDVEVEIEDDLYIRD